MNGAAPPNLSLNTYYEPAIGEWFWPKHRLKDEIQSYKLTIPKVMQYVLEGDDVIRFNIHPTAGFDKKPIAEKYNQGPYIDALICSFKPLNQDKCECVYDSNPSTPVREYLEVTNNNFSVTGSVGYTGINPSAHSGTPGVSATYIKSNGTHRTRLEFEDTVNLAHEKKIITYRMSVAYSETCDPYMYEVKNLTTMKERNCCRVDTLYKPPQCATSSFGAHWELNYKVSVGAVQQFELITEVRTVFVSNDWDVEKEDWFGEKVNWIKTVHKIVQEFSILVEENRKLSINLILTKVQQICSSGFNECCTSALIKENNSKTWLGNCSDAQKYCTIEF